MLVQVPESCGKVDNGVYSGRVHLSVDLQIRMIHFFKHFLGEEVFSVELVEQSLIVHH